jgi:tetratricopeptide (TPR) repeat protein
LIARALRRPIVAPVLALVTAIAAPPPASALPGAGGSSDPRRAESELRSILYRGARAVDSEDYATAEEILSRAVKLAPASVPAHYQLGRALAGLKRLKPASEQFEAALKIDPRHAGAILGLAAIDEGTGDYAGAERRYREATALGPNPRAARSLASLIGREGRSAEAQTMLAALLAADPNDADSRFELALARAISGGCDAAIPDFRKVLEIQPKRVTALFQLGNCLSRTGRTAEAEEVLRRFRENSDEERRRKEIDRKVHFTLLEADALAESGKPEAALAKAREAVALDPGSGDAHAFLGSLLTEAGKDGEALRELERAAEVDPTDILSLSEAGRLLAMAGRNDEALVYFRKAAAADVNPAEPHRFLAILYQQMGRREEAEREKAIYLDLSRAP